MTAAEIVELLVDGPLGMTLPILLLPLLSAWVSNRAAIRLPATRADWRIAALLAATPGITLLAMLAVAAGRSLLHLRHTGDIEHALEYHLVWPLAALILARPVTAAIRRHREIRLVVQHSASPGRRLRYLADNLGLRCRELPVDTRECFVAGWRRPTVYISNGVLLKLSDTELHSALCHERAHVDGHDAALLTVLAFLCDLVPGNEASLAAYRQSRERHADVRAMEASDPLSLASALLAFMRTGTVAAPGMSGIDAGDWRLRAILDMEADVPIPQRPLQASLAVQAGLAAWPAVQIALTYALCSS
jgi:hypothetical protein